MEIKENLRFPNALEKNIKANSLQGLLYRNIGGYVLIDSLFDQEKVIRKEGILYAVGNNYVILYNIDKNIYISLDLSLIEYVSFV